MASSFNPVAAYEAGLVGARVDPRADEEFGDYILRHGGNPNGSEIAHEWEFAGLGKGKLTLLFPAVMKVFPDCFPNVPQLFGDCFPAGTLVRMADGSEKPIESIEAGEQVVSHTGTPRAVEASFKKPYSGDLLMYPSRVARGQ